MDSTPARADEPDSRNSLRHILAADPQMDDPKPSPSQANTPGADESEAGGDAQDASRQANDSDPTKPYYTATTTTTRRNANGSVSSVYSGNKIKHLKKDDGIPLWRKDIQFDFLKLVFEDEQRVFTKQSDRTGGHTFADIYLDAMAKSSKCSKILKDKLLTERAAAINMAMVCLLVNVGRMNTTLNCKEHATFKSAV
jgi:Ino eighty subunit 1